MNSSTTNVPPGSSASPPGAAGSAEGQAVPVHMPKMGISVSEGTILEWRKAVGDAIEADETLADVTTDKVDVEIPCPATGVVSRLLVEVGESVEVGAVIAEIGPVGGAESTPAAAPHESDSDVPPADDAPASEERDRSTFVSPVVARMAGKHGIDLAQVAGTGIGGRVRKRDVLGFLESHDESGNGRPKAESVLHSDSPYRPDEPVAKPEAEAVAKPEAEQLEPQQADGERRERMSPMRSAIAKHMVESRRTAAHCTTIVEVDMSRVAARRAELKPAMARRGVPLTYLSFVAKATVAGLAEYPLLNSSVEGNEIVHHDDINLGIAVALDGGLIVPVIAQAQRLNVEGLAAAIADVAERARSKRLTPDEVQGGTFTITNPGQFGAVLATPIINQPQVAILDLEAIVKRPVVVTAADGSDSIAIRPMTYLCMSWDHRALDGADSARFLGAVKRDLEAGGEL